MGMHAVTVREFRVFVQATGYRTTSEVVGIGWGPRSGTWDWRPGINWRNTGFSQADDEAVVQISWHDAVAYCNWLSGTQGLTPAYSIAGVTDFMKWPNGWNSSTSSNVVCDWTARGYRLPTEAEWEFAARGVNRSRGFAYAGGDALDEVA